MVSAYARTLRVALRNQAVTLFSLLCAVVAHRASLRADRPRACSRRTTRASSWARPKRAADISFEAMLKLQTQALDIILADPAVAARRLLASAARAQAATAVNQGRMFISLKPLAERGGCTTSRVIDRMRGKLQGSRRPAKCASFASHDIRVGARQGNSQYQYTLWDPDIDELNEWVPKVLERMKRDSRARRCVDRPRAGRAAARRQDRPRRSGAARRAHLRHRQRAQQRLLAAADLDHLRPAQPVPRHPRGRPAAAARPLRPQEHLCAEHRRRRAGAADERDQRRGEHWRRWSSITRGRSPPSRSATIWRPATRSIQALRDIDQRHGRVCTRRPGLRGEPAGDARRLRRAGVAAAAADPRGAHRRLHRAGRALREPGAPADHHLDAALGRARRAAGAATWPAWSCR